MLDSLFVYGSFSEGMVHYDRLTAYLRESRPASITGCVYRLPIGYPVYLQQGYCQVPGQLVTVAKPEILFKLLDEFHGVCLTDPAKGLYTRVEAEVEAEGGRVCTFVYTFNPDHLPRNAKLIESGDWKKSLSENPALPMRLTERQRAYIRKLAVSSGRDIVPIDLTLYRELMRMDLVVDKGRRLALTQLGQDVARYIP